MPGGYLYGWPDGGPKWIKIACTAAGKLIADVSAIFENPPTEDLATKAPTSEWAYDHWKDAAAHHVKYTDADARDSMLDMWDSNGWATRNLRMQFNNIEDLEGFVMKNTLADTWKTVFTQQTGNANIYTYGMDGVTPKKVDWNIYNGSAYSLVVLASSFQTNLALFLEETPTNGVVNKGPTSNWAFDHDADASAHHAKYTDAEAQAACNLDGDLYWSCPGTLFCPQEPEIDDIAKSISGWVRADVDNIIFVCPVMLPDGTTVTGAVVYGNAAAEAETWTLRRIKLTDVTNVAMATAVIGTEDTTIANEVINNSLYTYLFYTTSLDTNDQIYGARISYIL